MSWDEAANKPDSCLFGIIYGMRRKQEFRFAVMSDVHANPHALERAIADARERGCERFIMLGDITGYGYDARESVRLVRENFDRVLCGNHDAVACGRDEYKAERNPNYRLDLEQGNALSYEDRKWMDGLWHYYEEAGAAFAHDNFVCPGDWRYVQDSQSALRSMLRGLQPVLFCGHTHYAMAFARSATGRNARVIADFDGPPLKDETHVYKLSGKSQYLANVGSVGYPRNDLSSTYVIWDPKERSITYRRLAFDFEGYIRRMREAGLPLRKWLRVVEEGGVPASYREYYERFRSFRG